MGSFIAAALLLFLLVITILCGMLNGTANHNNAAVSLTFSGGTIPLSMPAEYKEYIIEMRACFTALDTAISSLEDEMEEGDSLDEIRVKAVFYALYFGQENLRLHASRAHDFAQCFVDYETRYRPAEDDGEDGDWDEDDEEWEDEEPEMEEYEVAVPVEDLPVIYSRVASLIGRPITPEDQVNITEIYLRVKYNRFDVDADMPLEGGNGTHDIIGEMADSETPPAQGGIVSPLSGGWEDKVSSEFGYRPNPTGPGMDGHTGLDMAVPMGTDVHAIQGGKILFVRWSQTGYGYHAAIDHGGGFVTLYAHCSSILVSEGEAVGAGQTIALSGSTGNSTGPHLHLETIQNGTPQNPRGYLP